MSIFGDVSARLTVDEVALVFNCQPHDVRALVAARLLRPLGNPKDNARRFFARDEIRQLSKDPVWLSKMTNAIYRHWRDKNNAANGEGGEEGSQPSRLAA